MADETVDIVDENDIVIGTALRSETMAKRLRCRIAWIQVIDPETLQICMIRRGVTLGYKPNAWQFGAGGYVGSGETWEASAQRELQEELGLSAPLLWLTKIVGDSISEGLPFMHGYFVTVGTRDQLTADAREVAAIEFMTLDQARDIAEQAPERELTGTYRQTLGVLQAHWPCIKAFVQDNQKASHGG